MPAEAPPLLLVSVSARALAQSALRAGWSPRAIDAFADLDTRAAARCRRVPFGERGFERARIARAAAALAPPGVPSGVVYGSGVERAPQLISLLAQGRELFGNEAALVESVNDPRAFFALLERLGIAHPEVRFDPPAERGWLSKRIGAAGGRHVRHHHPGEAGARGRYYQRLVPGPAMSVLFLADGAQALVLGCNTLFTAGADARSPFLYGGAVNRASLGLRQRRRLAEHAGRLSAALGLRGLNSIDFVPHGEDCLVLELNPRPSATLELYEPEVEGGLVRLHIEACRGHLPQRALRGPAPVRALSIVYCHAPLRVPALTGWPEWCRDRPRPGLVIRPGQPICSVLAAGSSRREVARRLASRSAAMRARLQPVRASA